MQNPIHVELTCRYCPTITFVVDLPREKWAGVPITHEALGVADTRCETHRQQFGDFKEMHDQYLNAGGTYQEFKAHLAKTDYKKPKTWDNDLKKIKE